MFLEVTSPWFKKTKLYLCPVSKNSVLRGELTLVGFDRFVWSVHKILIMWDVEWVTYCNSITQQMNQMALLREKLVHSDKHGRWNLFKSCLWWESYAWYCHLDLFAIILHGFEWKSNNIRAVKRESHGGVGFVIVYEASRVLLRSDASH